MDRGQNSEETRETRPFWYILCLPHENGKRRTQAPALARGQEESDAASAGGSYMAMRGTAGVSRDSHDGEDFDVDGVLLSVDAAVQQTRERFAFFVRWLRTLQVPVRFGLRRVPTTRAIRGSPEHHRSSLA